MKNLSVLLLLTLLLVGCGAEPMPTEPTPTEPAPTPTEPAPTPVPTPAADKGAIVGRFVDFETGEPPRTTMPVFLGELAPLTPGDSFMITMLPTSAPQTAVDAQGYFAFSDVEPDTYAMIFWTPVKSWVISDPETEDAILVTVNVGETTDLGEVAVDLPEQP